MSAITPFLEHQDDPAETELLDEALEVPADVSEATGTLDDAGGVGSVEQLQALGRTAPSEEATIFEIGELTAAALNATHAGLMTTAAIRQSVEQALVGRSYRVQARDLRGAKPNEVFIILDGPIGLPDGFSTDDPRFPVAPWSPPASPNARQFSLLSWTSKMGAPSFSLPAGPVVLGGACPGANAGQSIVPVQTLRSAARHVHARLGKPVRLQQAICQYCYAEGGQYSIGQVQFAQVLRFIWTRDALRMPEGGLWSPLNPDHGPPPASVGHWLEAMAYAIDHADYKLNGGKVGKIDYPAERHPGRYFRIHDSGDFFAPGYVWMWVQLAHRFPDISFWAPSRYWATGHGVEEVNQINNAPNLVIRPSAYHVNEHPPRNLGPGWAAGSTAFALDQKPQGAAAGDFQWDCQTYAVDDQKHTCRHAEGFDGAPGCRACWRAPQAEVNYTLH